MPFLRSWFVLLAGIGGILAADRSPGRTWIVAPDGDDAGPGTRKAPFRTISRGAEVAQPGDTVLVRAGIYRERVASPRGGEEGRPITYRGEAFGKVFIRGSEEWKPQWERHGESVFFAVPEEALFDDDVYHDSGNPFRVELSSTPDNRDGKPEADRLGKGDPGLVYTCGQLIVNGKPWKQRPFLVEAEKHSQSWYFEPESGRVYVNFGGLPPGEQRIEIATRRRIFAPHVRGLGHIVVEGFVMEHCGNQYCTHFWRTPKWAQAGALGLQGGHHWVVRNNLIRYANTDGMDVGRGGGANERDVPSIPGAPYGQDNLIERNYLVDNGAGGIVGAQSTRMVIRGNVILRNNTQGFIGPGRYEHAGIKAHGIADAVIERNYVADNARSDGIWLDNQFPRTRVTRNVVVNNGVRGIFLEMSDYQWDAVLIDHNVSVGNRGIQFYAHDASGSTVMHNLFANCPEDARFGQGAYIYQVTARTKTGYHSFYNNLFINHRTMLDINFPLHRSGPQRLDHNIYDAAEDERTFVVNSASDSPSPWTPEVFLTLVRDTVGSKTPEKIRGGAKVPLTLAEWRSFWRNLGLANDVHSVALKGMKATYVQDASLLTLTVPFEPGAIGSTNHRGIDRDFLGQGVPQDGTAFPGPFQSLKRGTNVFEIWKGLPLLAEGQLP